MRLFDGAMTMWLSTSILPTKATVPQRRRREDEAGALTQRKTPEIKWAQARYAGKLQALKNLAHLTMVKYATRTPWSDGMYHVPATMVDTMGAKLQQVSAKLKKLQAEMLGSIHQDTLANQETLRSLADSEHKATDPFGFTDKKAWVKEYLADLTPMMPSSDAIRSQYIRAVAATVTPLVDIPPPGVHTMGEEAMRALAEDVAWSRLRPVLESMAKIREWALKDRAKAVPYHTEIGQLRRLVDELEAWGQYPNDPVVKAARSSLAYVDSMWTIIFKDVAQPQRDDLATLLLPGAKMLVDKKALDDRVEWLLG